jgi:hypothetical protein
MRLSDTHIKWIMVASGALTCTMLYAFIAPQAALTSTFGASLDGPIANVVVRNWGALITMIGGMLIYGAFHPNVQSFALVVATASKVVFIALVLAQGSRFLGYQAGTAILIDGIWVLIFVWYLMTVR